MRIRTLVLTLGASLLLSASPALAAPPARPTASAAAGPAGLPTESVTTLAAAGARGLVYVKLLAQDPPAALVLTVLQGLTPGARYRLVGSIKGCSTPYSRFDRILSKGFVADARGTYHLGDGVAATLSLDPLLTVRVLKGRSGSTQVACAKVVDLTATVGPTLDRIAFLASYSGGQAGDGMLLAVERPDGDIALTVSLRGLPRPDDLVVRPTADSCLDPWAASGDIARSTRIDVRDRAAFSRQRLSRRQGMFLEDLRGFWWGATGSAFAHRSCAAAASYHLVEQRPAAPTRGLRQRGVNRAWKKRR